MQDFGRGEAEKAVDDPARVDHGQRIGDQVSDGDDEHQVRNGRDRGFQTEAFEVFAEIFHMSTYLPGTGVRLRGIIVFHLTRNGKRSLQTKYDNVQVPFLMKSMDKKQQENRRFAVDF